MKDALISVIVPIYKVEKYLNKCLKSITNQTYKNLEIILVNDGSPDNCPQMCEEWAKKDSRIKVVHKENGGISSARNLGIKNSSGGYIAFVDSDDYVDITMFEKLLKSITDNNSDVAICGYFNAYENGDYVEILESNLSNLSKSNLLNFYIVSNSKKVDNKIVNDGISPSVWRMLYSKKVIENIWFEEDVKYGEDLLFNGQVFSKDIKISAVLESLYYYVQRAGSAVRLHTNDMIQTKFNYAKKKIKLVQFIKDKEKAEAFKFSIYKMIYWDFIKFKTIKAYKEFYKNLKEMNVNKKEYYKSFQKMIVNKKEKFWNFLIHKNKIHIMRFIYDIKQKLQNLFRRT